MEAYDRLTDDLQLARRFGAIEQQLRLLSEHLGVRCPAFASDGLTPDAEGPAGQAKSAASATPRVPAEVVDLARAGHTTEAISRLRHLTGATLLEAKRAVDSL